METHLTIHRDNHGVNRSRGLRLLGHHNVKLRDSVTPAVRGNTPVPLNTWLVERTCSWDRGLCSHLSAIANLRR
jgi:hypothetical protein